MKLLLLGSGKTVPSCRFRIVQLVPHLRAAGLKCVVANSFPQKYDYIPWFGFRPSQKLKRFKRYVDLARGRLGRFDAIVLERELFNDPSWDLEQRFFRLGIPIVFDIDDAVFLNFPEKSVELARRANLVLAGNRLLREWAVEYNSHVELMPTCIDTEKYSPRSRSNRRSDTPVVGWMGTAGNVAYLQWAAEGLRAAARRCKFELRVIAGGRGKLDELDLSGVDVRFVPWEPASEIEQLAECDIGLMPLADDPWSRYKCGLKLLQYMSLGIPGIASPVGVNADIIRHGDNGYLATSSDDWSSALERLVGDSEHRQILGQAAIETVEQSYSIRVNLPRWIAAVADAVRRGTLGQ